MRWLVGFLVVLLAISIGNGSAAARSYGDISQTAESAADDQINRSDRKLPLEYHSENSPGSEMEFKQWIGDEDETSEAVEVMSENSSAGSRRLLQNNQLPCPENYNFYDFSPILNACPNSTNITVVGTFDPKKCCQSLCTVLGANGSYINDMNYDCSAQFFSYLNLAGKYSQGYFANICTDPNSPDGIHCPPVEESPAPPGGNGGTSVGANSVLWSLILAVAIFEVLILLV